MCDPMRPAVYGEHAQRQSLPDVAELGLGDIGQPGISPAVFAVGIAIGDFYFV